MTLDEEVMGEESEKDEDCDEEAKIEASNVHVITSADELQEDKRCIAFASSLLDLAQSAPKKGSRCKVKGCDSDYDITTSKIGTSLYLTWVSISFM